MRAPISLLSALVLSACIQPTHEAHAQVSGPIPDRFEISGWDVKCWDSSPDDHICSMERRVTGVGFFRFTFDEREVQLYGAKCQPQSGATERSFARRQEDPAFSRALYREIRSIVDQCNHSALSELDNSHNLIELLLRATN